MKFENLERKLARFAESSQWPHMALHSPDQQTLYDAVEATLTRMYGLSQAPVGEKNPHVLRVDCLLHADANVVQKHILPWIKSAFTARAAGAPFRTVVFFHAERLTMDAQSALRRVIELHSTHTRFLITCTSTRNLIRPIQSRLACIYIAERHKSVSRAPSRTDIACEGFMAWALKALWGFAADGAARCDMDLGSALDACFDQLRERNITAADLSDWIERMTLLEFASITGGVHGAFVEGGMGERAQCPHKVYEAHAAAKRAAFANRHCDREAVHEWLALFLSAAAAPQK